MKVFYNLFIVVAVIIFGNSNCDVSELFPEHRSLPDSKGSIEDQFNILTKQDINSPEYSNANLAVRNDIDIPNLPPFPMLRLAGMDLMEINNLINHNGFKPSPYNQAATQFNQQNDVNSVEAQLLNFDAQQNNLNPQYLPQRQDEQPQQNQYTQKYDENGGYDYSKPAKAFPTHQQAVNRFAAPEEPQQPEPTVVSDDVQQEFQVNLNAAAPKDILLNRINDDDDDKSADDTPAVDIPVQDTPAEDKPVEDTPAVEIPADDTPAEDTPVEGTPAVDTPAEDTPKEDAPVNFDTTKDHQDISKDIEELTVSVNNFVSSEKPLKYEEQQNNGDDENENIETDKNLSVTNLLPIPEEPRPFNVPIANRIQDETEEKPSEDTIASEKSSTDEQSSEVAEETDESFKEPAVVPVPQIEIEKEVNVSEQENVAPLDSVDVVTQKTDEKPELDVEKIFADIVPLSEQADHDAVDVPIDDDNVDVKQNDIENENNALVIEDDEPLRVRFDEKNTVDLDSPVIAQDAVAFLPSSEPSQQSDDNSSETEVKQQPEISTDDQSFQPIVPLQTNEQEIDDEQPQQQLDDENVSVQPIVALQEQEQNEPKSEENDSFQPIVPLQTQDEFGKQSNDEENASIQPIVPLDTAEGDIEQAQQAEPIDISAAIKAEDVNNMEDIEVSVKNADNDVTNNNNNNNVEVEQQNNVDAQSSLGLRVDIEQESEEEKHISEIEIPVQPTQSDINNLDVDEPAIVRFQADQVNQSEKSSEEFDGYHYPKPANPIVLPPRFRGQALASQQNQNVGDIPNSFARIDNK